MSKKALPGNLIVWLQFNASSFAKNGFFTPKSRGLVGRKEAHSGWLYSAMSIVHTFILGGSEPGSLSDFNLNLSRGAFRPPEAAQACARCLPRRWLVVPEPFVFFEKSAWLPASAARKNEAAEKRRALCEHLLLRCKRSAQFYISPGCRTLCANIPATFI